MPEPQPPDPPDQMDTTPAPDHPVITPPRPRETADLTLSDGAEIRLRRHGQPDGPRLVLSHGNGLAIEGYAPFWMPLAERYDVILFDQRNHGCNPRHSVESHTWDRIARDQGEVQAAIRANFGDRPAVGVLHSLSTIANIRHWLTCGPHGRPPWAALVLVDLPIMPPPGHPLISTHRQDMRDMGGRAARRPTDYADPSELAARLTGRPEFQGWLPGAPELIARETLRHNPVSGRWDLACPRECEARIFETNLDGEMWRRLPEIDAPIYLLGADPTMPWRQAPAVLTARLARDLSLPYDPVPGTSHMLQIEKPLEAIRLIERFLAPLGLAA